MAAFTRVVMAATSVPAVRRAVTGTRAGRALAGRFVAGETLEEAVAVARRANRRGQTISLDLLGEEVATTEAAHRATEQYLEGIDRIARDRLVANLSVKLTQLGLAIDASLAAFALDRLAVAAADAGTTVTIDMEDSRYVAATVDLYAQAQPRHGNLGLCLQAYLHRTPADLERLMPLGGHLRLCKGAYAELPEVALQGRDEVDLAFARLLGALMAVERVHPAIATHDEDLIALALDLGRGRRTGFELQMLYGVQPRLQRRLAAAGHDLRIYLPYGTAWYPYLTRRLAERPANAWFFLRSLLQR